MPMLEVSTMEGPVLTEWNATRHAAQFLRCMPEYLNDKIGHYFVRRNANREGARTARSGGWLYHRHSLERVRAIMDALGVEARRGAELYHAIRTLRDRELLEAILEGELTGAVPELVRDADQIDIDDQLKRKRRRQ